MIGTALHTNKINLHDFVLKMNCKFIYHIFFYQSCVNVNGLLSVMNMRIFDIQYMYNFNFLRHISICVAVVMTIV